MVGHRTEAIYTHLRPGRYSFHVQASNGSGDWTPIASAVPFTIEPFFYQTTWFLVVCATIALFLFWTFFRVRLRHLSARIRERANDRAEERVRIARDLHDTLLQGVQILLLTFQTVTERLPSDEGTRQLLNGAITRAEDVISEGRSQVKRLRSEHHPSEHLLSSIESIARELNTSGTVNCKVQQHGNAKELRETAAVELYYLGREALANAFRHSGATSIVVAMHYGRRTFLLTCQDDGCGFDAENLLKRGVEGHWGLQGMTERANTIGAQFVCNSHPGKGTEIKVSLDSTLAYADGHLLPAVLMKFFTPGLRDAPHRNQWL